MRMMDVYLVIQLASRRNGDPPTQTWCVFADVSPSSLGLGSLGALLLWKKLLE